MTNRKEEIRPASSTPLPSSFLETREFNGGGRVVTVQTPIRPNGFNYGQNLVMASSQLRSVAEHHPIRVAEQTLTFDISHRTILHRLRLHDRIRAHHRYALAMPIPAPMVLFLAPVFKVFKGIIEEVEDGDKRHQAAYKVNYSMKLMTDIITSSTSLAGDEQPYLPSAQTVADYGDDWLNFIPPGPVIGWDTSYNTDIRIPTNNGRPSGTPVR